MKKKLVLGMLVLTMSNLAFAAGAKEGKGREELAKAMSGVKSEALGKFETQDKIASTLAGSAPKNARSLKMVLSKSFRVKNADTMEDVSFEQIGKLLADRKTRLENVNKESLDGEAREIADLMEKGISVSAHFMALFNRMPSADAKKDAASDLIETDGFKKNATLEAALEGAKKQASLIPDIMDSMTKAEMQSHIDFMERTIEAYHEMVKEKGIESVTVVDAFMAAYKKDGESVDSFLKRLEALLNCLKAMKKA